MLLSCSGADLEQDAGSEESEKAVCKKLKRKSETKRLRKTQKET